MTITNIPFSFESEAAKLVWTLRRQVIDTKTRFQMMRIAEYIRQAEFDAIRAEDRLRVLAQAKAKSAATRAHNADPFGFKATRELMKSN